MVQGTEDNIHSYLTYTDKDTKYAIVSNIVGLVEPSIWISVNKDMDKNISREGNRFSEKFWLTKTIRCKCCGQTYCGQTKTTKTKYYNKKGEEKIYVSTYSYYSCRDAVRGKLKTCNNTKRIKQDVLEAKVSALIYSLKDEKIFNSSYSINKVDNSFKIASLNKKVIEIDKTISNLTDKIALLSNDASLIFIDKIENLIKEKSSIKSNIVELELQELNSKIKTDKALIYNNIKAFNNNLSVDDKRKITMSIFKKIVYNPETNDLDVTFM